MAAATAAAGYYYVSTSTVRLGVQTDPDISTMRCHIIPKIIAIALLLEQLQQARYANLMISWYAEDLYD